MSSPSRFLNPLGEEADQGYVLQATLWEGLDEVVRTWISDCQHVAGGTPHSSPREMTSLFANVAGVRAEPDRPRFPALTKREEQILQLLADGLSNKEIAQRLYLQPQTVKNYVPLILQKLGLQSRFEVLKLLRPSKP